MIRPYNPVTPARSDQGAQQPNLVPCPLLPYQETSAKQPDDNLSTLSCCLQNPPSCSTKPRAHSSSPQTSNTACCPASSPIAAAAHNYSTQQLPLQGTSAQQLCQGPLSYICCLLSSLPSNQIQGCCYKKHSQVQQQDPTQLIFNIQNLVCCQLILHPAAALQTACLHQPYLLLPTRPLPSCFLIDTSLLPYQPHCPAAASPKKSCPSCSATQILSGTLLLPSC